MKHLLWISGWLEINIVNSELDDLVCFLFKHIDSYDLTSKIVQYVVKVKIKPSYYCNADYEMKIVSY